MVFVANAMLGLKITSSIDHKLLNIITYSEKNNYLTVRSHKDLFLDRYCFKYTSMTLTTQPVIYLLFYLLMTLIFFVQVKT